MSKSIKDEVNLIQSSSKINAVHPLQILSTNLRQYSDLTMTSFISTDNKVNTEMKIEKLENMGKIKKALKALPFEGIVVDAEDKTGIIKLEFGY